MGQVQTIQLMVNIALEFQSLLLAEFCLASQLLLVTLNGLIDLVFYFLFQARQVEQFVIDNTAQFLLLTALPEVGILAVLA